MASVSSIARSLIARRALLSSSSSRLCALRQPSCQLAASTTTFSHNFFSTAPVKKTKPKRRRTLETKNPIIVTERAADRIKELLSGDNAEGAMGIILGVKRRKLIGVASFTSWHFRPSQYSIPFCIFLAFSHIVVLSGFPITTMHAPINNQSINQSTQKGGCNGLSYTLNYAFEEPKDAGAKMEAHGIQVFIEPMALFSIIGTQMDWEEDEMTSEFTFHNPNSKGECGCGESFNV